MKATQVTTMSLPIEGRRVADEDDGDEEMLPITPTVTDDRSGAGSTTVIAAAAAAAPPTVRVDPHASLPAASTTSLTRGRNVAFTDSASSPAASAVSPLGEASDASSYRASTRKRSQRSADDPGGPAEHLHRKKKAMAKVMERYLSAHYAPARTEAKAALFHHTLGVVNPFAGEHAAADLVQRGMYEELGSHSLAVLLPEVFSDPSTLRKTIKEQAVLFFHPFPEKVERRFKQAHDPQTTRAAASSSSTGRTVGHTAGDTTASAVANLRMTYKRLWKAVQQNQVYKEDENIRGTVIVAGGDGTVSFLMDQIELAREELLEELGLAEIVKAHYDDDENFVRLRRDEVARGSDDDADDDDSDGEVKLQLRFRNYFRMPAVAPLPLGTGNDYAHCVGFGSGFTRHKGGGWACCLGESDVAPLLESLVRAPAVPFDRWTVSFVPLRVAQADVARRYEKNKDKPKPKAATMMSTVTAPGMRANPYGIQEDNIANYVHHVDWAGIRRRKQETFSHRVINYLGIGYDGFVTCRFDEIRKQHPVFCSGRIPNKTVYGIMGLSAEMRCGPLNKYIPLIVVPDPWPKPKERRINEDLASTMNKSFASRRSAGGTAGGASKLSNSFVEIKNISFIRGRPPKQLISSVGLEDMELHIIEEKKKKRKAAAAEAAAAAAAGDKAGAGGSAVASLKTVPTITPSAASFRKDLPKRRSQRPMLALGLPEASRALVMTNVNCYSAGGHPWQALRGPLQYFPLRMRNDKLEKIDFNSTLDNMLAPATTDSYVRQPVLTPVRVNDAKFEVQGMGGMLHYGLMKLGIKGSDKIIQTGEMFIFVLCTPEDLVLPVGERSVYSQRDLRKHEQHIRSAADKKTSSAVRASMRVQADGEAAPRIEEATVVHIRPHSTRYRVFVRCADPSVVLLNSQGSADGAHNDDEDGVPMVNDEGDPH